MLAAAYLNGLVGAVGQEHGAVRHPREVCEGDEPYAEKCNIARQHPKDVKWSQLPPPLTIHGPGSHTPPLRWCLRSCCLVSVSRALLPLWSGRRYERSKGGRAGEGRDLPLHPPLPAALRAPSFDTHIHTPHTHTTTHPSFCWEEANTRSPTGGIVTHGAPGK